MTDGPSKMKPLSDHEKELHHSGVVSFLNADFDAAAVYFKELSDAHPSFVTLKHNYIVAEFSSMKQIDYLAFYRKLWTLIDSLGVSY